MTDRRVKLEMAAGILLGALRGASALLIAWFVSRISDMVMAGRKEQWAGLTLAIFLYYLGYLGLYYAARRKQLSIHKHIRIWLTEKMAKGLLWESQERHGEKTEGEITSRLHYTVQVLEQSYYSTLMSLIEDGIVFIIALAAVTAFHLITAAGILTALGLYLMLTGRINRKLENLQNMDEQANRREMQEVDCLVKSYHTARDYGRGEYFLERYVRKAADAAQASRKYLCTYALLSAANENLEPLLALGVICGGGFLYGQTPGITIGGIMAAVSLLTNMIGPVSRFGTAYAGIRATASMRSKTREWEQDGILGIREWKSSGPAEERPPVITLENVEFSYDEKKILENASAVFEAGKKYALIGESGEGKTTLLRLLLKQQKPQKGNICWNGKDYEEISSGELLNNISYMGQAPMIFHRSIRDNITAGRRSGKSGKSLEQAAAESGAVHIAEGKKSGMDTVVQTSGTDLSGGEKQRIAFARALYKNAPFLILDEYQSAVSEDAAAQLEKTVLSLKGKTVIVVTHRLKKEEYCRYDGVYRLENGQLTACRV